MTEEDEAFNEIERQAKQRKESVMAAVHTLTEYQRGYETGFIDGMQKQMQSSVDKAVNAMSQTQEPVAWYYPDGSPDQCTTNKAYAEMEPAWTPLYSHPPQRTWVGLTDEQKQVAIWTDGTFGAGALWAEAKLKEKNI